MTAMGETAISTVRESVVGWLAEIEQALVTSDGQAVANMFVPDGIWRDVLALTGDLHTYCGVQQIHEAMVAALGRTRVVGLSLDDGVPVRAVQRGGEAAIEAVFAFQTAIGRGRGVMRLAQQVNGERPRALALLTALMELRGFEERIGKRRPSGSEYGHRFGGPNWLDERTVKARYERTDPAVLVVGGGQAGLGVAARLGQLDVDTLVIDRLARIGDNWRNRYHSLVLHNEVWVNHLPYMPFPDTWPTYIPKDKLADWFEAYVASMEINYWTGTELIAAEYDHDGQHWRAIIRHTDGSQRTLRPRHIVMATGVNGIPNIPKIPGLKNFAGEVLHSSAFADGSTYAGKSVLVIGSCSSGHDIAQEMYNCGAEVALVQRSPTTVTSIGPDAAGRIYALYSEGLSTEDCDLISLSIAAPTLRRSHQLLTREWYRLDRELLAGLGDAGFCWDYGEDSTGWQMKFLRHGGGFYLNVGCSDLIVDGRVTVIQFADIAEFTSHGVTLGDGRTLAVDVIVLATGYHTQQALVRQLFGDDVAERVGPIWGFDAEGELRNMWKRTAQPGLWFSAGSFAQCRIFSKFLALQIKACELHLLPLARDEAIPVGSLRAIDLTDAG
jgi:cation diffusion facilitator CzcD-associated flavoprotein CzcO